MAIIQYVEFETFCGCVGVCVCAYVAMYNQHVNRNVLGKWYAFLKKNKNSNWNLTEPLVTKWLLIKMNWDWIYSAYVQFFILHLS